MGENMKVNMMMVGSTIFFGFFLKSYSNLFQS